MVRKIGTERIAALALALVGCRAVIGIEELRRDVDAGTADAALDAGLDSAPDAVSDAIAPPDAAKPTVGQCNGWCRTDGGAGAGASAFSSEMRSCLCQGSTLKACETECGGLCPNGSPPSASCETCMLQQVLDDGGVCAAKASTCTSPCQSFVQCVKGCL